MSEELCHGMHQVSTDKRGLKSSVQIIYLIIFFPPQTTKKV